jgi:hypothetical protein
LLLLTLGQTLEIFENKVVNEIRGSKREELLNSEYYKAMSFVIYTGHVALFG